MNATKTVFAAILFLNLLACGAVSTETPGEDPVGDEAADELSATNPGVVALRVDARRCLFPSCGGYFVRELNRNTAERYVSGLDLSASGLTADEISQVLEAPAEELVVRGKLGPVDAATQTRPLLVSDVWRGLPGVKAADGDVFYFAARRSPEIQCFTTPCPNELASKVNARANTKPVEFSGYALARAALTGVDTTWLVDQVKTGQALVAAKFTVDSQSKEKNLDAGQVFVAFPSQKVSCPRVAPTQCAAGTQPTVARDAHRCLLPEACVAPTFCPMVMPSCAAGYTLSQWNGKSGCIEYACDPSFAAP